MRLDTHQHFWSLANSFTDWPTPNLAPIHRDFGPHDIARHLVASGIDSTILVQAAPSVAETEYCLAIAADFEFIRGVVGWVDFAADDAPDEIARLASNPLLMGLRPMVQSIDEAGWLLKPELAPAFSAMLAHGLTFDGLVLTHQIGDLDALARRYPELPIVLDHAGKPPIAAMAFVEWSYAILNLGRNPNVHCKLSGLWTEAGADISQANIRPWVDHLLNVFGAERLMWGSDWPVINLAGTYGDWMEQCEIMLADLTCEQRDGVFGGNGGRFYGID